MAKEVTVSTLRQNLADALKAIEKGKDYMIVTKRGKMVSAIVSPELFEDFLALSSPKYLKSIKEAREDVKKGRVTPIDKVFGKL